MRCQTAPLGGRGGISGSIEEVTPRGAAWEGNLYAIDDEEELLRSRWGLVEAADVIATSGYAVRTCPTSALIDRRYSHPMRSVSESR